MKSKVSTKLLFASGAILRSRELLGVCPHLVCFLFSHFYFSASGQAVVVTGVVPFPPRFLPSIFIAHRVQQSHCSSIFHRVLLTHALALSGSQFVYMKKSQRICTSTCMHSAGLELTKLTWTRLEDNLLRHRRDIDRRLPLELARTRVNSVVSINLCNDGAHISQLNEEIDAST